MRVAIATDTVGWQGEQLRVAFDRRGIEVTFFSLRQCTFDTAVPHGLRIPGFDDCLPDGVFVRQVPGGSLEQVVLRLDFLHCLKEAGVLVYNDGRAIERTVDKAMTTWLMQRAGIATPPSWTLESPEPGRALLAEELGRGHEVVFKPLFGSQGKGLIRMTDVTQLPALDIAHGVYYMQRFIAPRHGEYCDWRAFVIAGEVVGAMQRRGSHWIGNVAQGAQCVAATLDANMLESAQAACAAVGVAYGGVDLMRDASGETLVIEVNGIPAWQGLQSVCERNIAELLVEDFLRRC